MRKVFVALALILLLTGCGNQDAEVICYTHMKETETTAATQATTVAEYLGETTSEWVQVQENVYDISTLVDPTDERILVRIIPEERLLVYLDYHAEQYEFVPFHLEALVAQTDSTALLQMDIRSAFTVKGNYLQVMSAEWSYPRTVMGYDLAENHALGEIWTMPDWAVIGNASEPGKALIVEADEKFQRVYRKDMEDGTEETQFTWEISDRTQVPTITHITQGEQGYAFLGWILPTPEAQSVMCYGLIDQDGQIVALEKRGEFDYADFQGGYIIYDTIAAYGHSAEKTAVYHIYDGNTMRISQVHPETQQESVLNRICVSENGRYIVTGNSDREDGCYRVYDVETDTLVAKYECGAIAEDIIQQTAYVSERDVGFYVLTRTVKGTLIHYYQY